MTDSAGAIAETMDYFPFGEIRINSGSYSEQRKYIGQEYDQDTGLNYLNARYYNSSIGRFISEDPMFWAISAEWLQDPQNQNAYSYARNNPITLSDPSGETVWIESKPVFDVKGQAIGVHTYFKAVPDHPDEINIQGLPRGTEGFTMGGYNSDNKYLGLTNKLIKNMGTTETSWDKKTAFEGGAKINSMEINPPEGQNDTQFINNLGKIYNETDLSGMNYSWWGQTQLPFGFNIKEGNCNVFSYTMGVKAGVKDQMDAFNPDPNKTAAGGYPGYRYQLSSQTLLQQVQSRVDVLKERINNYVSSLIKK
ncbi:MAG: RHS repeat-associated core domain-containing protein [Patescibacteria group bacterium]